MEEIGQKALSTILKKQKNIDVFNKYLLSCSNGEIEYKNNLYQLCHELKKGDREHRDILSDLKKGKVGWDSIYYEEMTRKQEEKDEFLNNPFNVEEGVNECKKCGSKKTFSYTKQMRCADEGTTVFCICVKCNHRWKFG